MCSSRWFPKWDAASVSVTHALGCRILGLLCGAHFQDGVTEQELTRLLLMGDQRLPGLGRQEEGCCESLLSPGDSVSALWGQTPAGTPGGRRACRQASPPAGHCLRLRPHAVSALRLSLPPRVPSGFDPF